METNCVERFELRKSIKTKVNKDIDKLKLKGKKSSEPLPATSLFSQVNTDIIFPRSWAKLTVDHLENILAQIGWRAGKSCPTTWQHIQMYIHKWQCWNVSAVMHPIKSTSDDDFGVSYGVRVEEFIYFSHTWWSSTHMGSWEKFWFQLGTFRKCWYEVLWSIDWYVFHGLTFCVLVIAKTLSL